MNGEPDWPSRLADYERAVEEFECLSRALTAALTDGGPLQTYRKLMSAEAVARNRVVATRKSLIDLLPRELHPQSAQDEPRNGLH